MGINLEMEKGLTVTLDVFKFVFNCYIMFVQNRLTVTLDVFK